VTKYIFLAALAALAGLSIGSKAPADMPFMPLGGGGGATSGYPVKIDVRAELEANRTVEKGIYCAFMRRSQACPHSPWGAS